MSVIPPLGSTWVVTLESLGTAPGPRFLDGHTHDGTVGLAHTTDPPYTGTLWAAMRIAPSGIILRCLGETAGPGFHGFLDGRTQDATVGLAETTGPPFSGTRWMADVGSSGDGSLTLRCLGDIAGPGSHGFLDGRTHDGTVGLAPNTQSPFTGTRWRSHFLGELVILQCLGDVPGPRFLDGRTHDGTVGLAPTTADPFTGTLWQMRELGGITTLKSLGKAPGPRFLDGRTQDASVVLSDTTDPPFTGTRWKKVEIAPGVIALMCLGEVPGPGFHGFLDGRTHDGTVGLAPNTNPPFTGTRWRLMPPSMVIGNTSPHKDDVLAVHAALFPTSEIVYFGGDEHDRGEHESTTLRSLGNVPGPRFLDGNTQDGSVGLAHTADPPFTGTRWARIEVRPGEIELMCLGKTQGQGFHGLLDGRTHDGTVGLAPPPAENETLPSGTRWRPHFAGELVTLECLGEVPGSRFLDGRTHDGTVGLAPTTADPFTGTLWQMKSQDGFTTLRSLGHAPGPRFLDGHTQDGTVRLAHATDPPFTGTRWKKVDVAPGVIELRCLGEVPGPGFQGFLDGRAQWDTVGLAHTTDPPFSGTRWRLRSLGKLTTLECLGDIPGSRFLDGRTHDGTVGLAPSTADPYTGTLWQTSDRSDVDHTRLFSCATARDRRIGSPASDVFCCGHALLADGQLLVAGGTERFLIDPVPSGGADHGHHFPGLHDAWLFNPFTRAWTKIASMSSSGPLESYRKDDAPDSGNPGGRWYPMLLTLGTGDVLTVSGHPSTHDTRHNHHIPERFSPALGTWVLLAADLSFEGMGQPFMYPRLHLLPNGKVFCSTPLELGTPQSQLIDPTTGARARAAAPPPKDPDPTRNGEDNINWGTDYSQDGSSVLLPLLPPDYRARVLRCGAEQPVLIDLQPLLDNPLELQTLPNHPNTRPRWAPTAPRQLLPAPGRYDNPNPRRFHLNAVLLPTGDVFVCGGCARFRIEESAVLESELYHPPSGNRPDRWESLPAATVTRNYHSVALLLPDGRVWTAGSNHGGQQGRENLEPRIEILNPPYVGAPNRPQITSAIEEIVPGGARFTIETPQARSVARVAILRVASVTHSFSSDQRYVGLDFSVASDRQLNVAAPPNHNIAPPGYYLLFVLDQAGLPSEGRFVRVA